MFSSMRPRPCGNGNVLALVLISFGLSSPSTGELDGTAKLPAVMVRTVLEQTPSVTTPVIAGFIPPYTRYVVGPLRANTLPRAAFGVMMLPLNSPVHGACVVTGIVRTSVLRLK